MKQPETLVNSGNTVTAPKNMEFGKQFGDLNRLIWKNKRPTLKSTILKNIARVLNFIYDFKPMYLIEIVSEDKSLDTPGGL